MTSQPRIAATALTPSEKAAWLRLSRAENVGPITFYRLLEYYKSAQSALDALPELAKRGGRKKPLVAPAQSKIEDEIASLQKAGGDFMTAADDTYPLALGAIDDAPPVLSYLGNLEVLNRCCVAIVGARNASINGRKFAASLARDLGAKNITIISGFARGIDTAAHQGSLESGTVAVMAGGIDIIYPEENAALYKEIAERGLILAESPFGQKPFAQSFPRRNRIVSGLSKGVVVIEATKQSGSLITARMAGEQGRDVFAVPGHPLDPRAQGPNHLIREGATLVRGVDDILETILDFSGTTLREPVFVQPPLQAPPASPSDVPEGMGDTVLEHLSFTSIGVDELIRSCHVSIPVLQTVLLELELAGRVKRLPGNRVILTDEGS